MSNNTKEQRAQKRAIIEAHVKERTHKLMNVKMTTELHAKLKSDADRKGMKLGRYVGNLIERGMEAL